MIPPCSRCLSAVTPTTGRAWPLADAHRQNRNLRREITKAKALDETSIDLIDLAGVGLAIWAVVAESGIPLTTEGTVIYGELGANSKNFTRSTKMRLDLYQAETERIATSKVRF